jgi:hypothetical protein
MSCVGTTVKWSLIVGGTVTGVMTFFLYNTKPTEQHFKKRFSENVNPTKFKLINKGLEFIADSTIDFDYQDWFVASSMIVKAPNCDKYLYLGLLNNWFPTSAKAHAFFPEANSFSKLKI